MTSLSSLGARHQPLRDMVASELRRLIISGGLMPGERLTEDRLADQLGVSRNPVREAIRVLSAEGFVDVTARRGACVSSMSAEQAVNLFDVRLVLEPLGAKLAATHAAPVDIARLIAILESARVATEHAHLDELSDLNTEFHCGVFETSGNAYLNVMAIPMVKRAQWLFRLGASDRAPHSWTEHQNLMIAIQTGDSERAESEARNHVLVARAAFFRVT